MPKISSAAALGQQVKARRKASGMTQVEAAGACGVGVRFLSELERGKASVQLESIFAVLTGLGLELRITSVVDDVVELSRDCQQQQRTMQQQLSDCGELGLATQVAEPEMPACWATYHRAAKRLHNQTPAIASHAVEQPPQSVSNTTAKRSLTGL